MTNRFQIALLVSTMAVALAAPARAAEAAPAADDQGLSEIIVTAQKREENLQRTPIAISVLRADDLDNRQVQSILDLGDGAIPSLRIAPFFSRPGALIVNIRGVGVLSDSNQPARDQGVGVYIDGVYYGRPQGLGAALFEVQNIEVLKGPQGTLFGRNTEGGAVNIVTRKPGTEFRGDVTATYGNFDAYKIEAHFDLPVSDTLSVKADGIVSARDGVVKNPLPGQLDYNGYTRRGMAVSVFWKPSSDFNALVTIDRTYDATTPLFQNLLAAPRGAPATAAGSPAINPNRLSALAVVQPNRVRVAPFGTPQQYSVGNTRGIRLNLEWNALPDLKIRSISSYRELTQSQFDNGNAVVSAQQPLTTANPTGSFVNFPFARYSLAFFRQNQVAQELQLIGEFPRLKYQVGALYFEERVQDNAQAFNTLQFTDAAGSQFIRLPFNAATARIDRASYVKAKSVGVYGQATYNPPILDDKLNITVGARFTRDTKLGSLFTINGLPPVVPRGGVNVSGPIALDAGWSRVDPLVNLALNLTDATMVYGKWSTGYRSGGANSRSITYAPFDPETVSIFEVGLKTQFFDNRARLNLAAYAGSYKNIQLDFFGLYEDIVNGARVVTTRTTSDTVNAPGTGRVRGFEAELTLAPTRGLTLATSYAYNDVRIPATRNPFPQPGNNGQPFAFAIPIYQVYTPAHSATGSINYELPLNGFTLRAYIDGNYNSGYFANNNDPLIDRLGGAVRLAQPKGDAAFTVNGRLALADIDFDGRKLTVALWSRNLFNEQHVFYRNVSATAGETGFYNEPRTFGIEANIKL
jgi:iron complex outermembrane recepter protein